MQKNINIGTANNQDGDFVRDAFDYTEDNFTELYARTYVAGNTVFIGGVTPLGGLDYYVWASAYMIDNVFYNDLVGGTVTIGTPDLIDPRIDSFYIENNGVDTPTVGIEPGTPDPNPIKPILDQTTKVEVSFQLVTVGFGGPNPTNTILIYDESVGSGSGEWDNASLPVGANLTDATAPFRNTVAINIPSTIGGSSSFMRFNSGTTFPNDDTPGNVLLFALKTTASWTSSTRFKLKLGNGGNSATINFTRNSIKNYGFQHTQTDTWQLVSVPIANYPNGFSTVLFVEFEFVEMPEINLDLIAAQIDATVTGNNTYLNLDDTIDTSYIGKNGYVPVVTNQNGLILTNPSSIFSETPQALQSVTDEGNNTTNSIFVNKTTTVGNSISATHVGGSSSSLGFTGSGGQDVGSLALGNEAGNTTILMGNDAATFPYFIKTPIKASDTYNLPLTVNGTAADSTGDIAITSAAFQVINEGSGNGIIKTGRTAVNYGNVGLNAVDASYSSGASATRGATGSSSFTVGEDVTAAGYAAMVLGESSSAAGNNSFVTGYLNTVKGYGSIVIGTQNTVQGIDATANSTAFHTVGGINNDVAGDCVSTVGKALFAKGFGMTVVGTANLATTYSFQYNIIAPRFIVGIGSTVPVTHAANVRANGFEVWSNGKIIANKYGSGTFTGTATYALQVDASGNIIEGALAGYVTKVGTPINNQLGVWTGDGTLEGDTKLTFDSTTSVLSITGTTNSTIKGTAAVPFYIKPGEAGYMGLGATTFSTTFLTIQDSNTTPLQNAFQVYSDQGGSSTREFYISNTAGGVYFTALGSNDTESYIIGINNTNGLLSKRSVTSIRTSAVVTNVSTTYNFVLGDANNIVTLNNVAAVSAVIPANASVAYPVGTKIDIINLGAGTVTVSITTDTLNGNVGGLTLAQYDKRTITKVTSTSWVLGY
ncbi:MAG: beta strand repeat-containing protein [Chitinophagaceae bacterium]